MHLVEALCHYVGIAADRVTYKGPGNTIADAKAVIRYLGAQKLGIPSSSIAIGRKVSQAANFKSVKRGLAYCVECELDIDRFAIQNLLC